MVRRSARVLLNVLNAPVPAWHVCGRITAYCVLTSRHGMSALWIGCETCCAAAAADGTDNRRSRRRAESKRDGCHSTTRQAEVKPREQCDSRGRAVSGCLLKWIASSVGSISTIALLLQLTVTRTCTRCFEDARYPPRHSMPAALLLLMCAPRTPSPRKIGAPLETPAARTDGCRWPHGHTHECVRGEEGSRRGWVGAEQGLEFWGSLGGRAGVRHSERQDVKLGKGGVAQNLRKRTQSLR